jgi:hypothetical protein
VFQVGKRGGESEPFVVEVGFVSDQDDDDIVASFGTDIVYPFGGILEACPI